MRKDKIISIYRSKNSSRLEKRITDRAIDDRNIDPPRALGLRGSHYKWGSLTDKIHNYYGLDNLMVNGRRLELSPEVIAVIVDEVIESYEFIRIILDEYKGVKPSTESFDYNAKSHDYTRLHLLHFINCFSDKDSKNKLHKYMTEKMIDEGNDIRKWRVETIDGEMNYQEYRKKMDGENGFDFNDSNLFTKLDKVDPMTFKETKEVYPSGKHKKE